MWLGFGGGADTLEGSPIDSLIFFILILAAFVALARRRLNWSTVISENWPIFLFYAFLLISVLWANSPFISFKRWFKEFGNIAVLLVILTDPRQQAARGFCKVRCCFPCRLCSCVRLLGRFYTSHGVGTGVLTKNSLGVLLLFCRLVLLGTGSSFERATVVKNNAHGDENSFGLASLYLMHLSDSKTSMVCLFFGAAIILATRLRFFRKQPHLLGMAALAVVLMFWVLDQTIGVKERVVTNLGRDMTFTGRTDVWRELLGLHTDPLLGVGFMSFWDDKSLLSRLPEWVGKSAHNGYLEEYLGGGWVAIFFLTVMLLASGLRINKALGRDGDYGAVRLGIFSVFLIGNFSESNIAIMSPIGFLFLLAAIGHAQTGSQLSSVSEDLP